MNIQNQVVREDIINITSHPLPWQLLAGKTVLISGASGFLPTYLVETLLYLNDTRKQKTTNVIGLVRNKEKASTLFAHHGSRKDLHIIKQDICQPFSISEKIDYIIHAASQASPKYYGKDPVGTLCANVLGTHHLLQLAKTNKVESFLFFSGGEVYGEVKEDQIPTREDAYGYVDPLNVRSCYAESKRMGENMCVCWCHQYGVPAKIIRLYHTYGPGMRLDDGRVFADFIADIVHRRDIIMRSDGSARRAFCYIADAIWGIFLVLLQGKNGNAYNIGNDKGEMSIVEFANLIATLSPYEELKVIREEEMLPPGYLQSRINRACPDISKIKALGWEPIISVEEGIERTIRSYLS
jgi:UDP-glucuronate decarboxylase